MPWNVSLVYLQVDQNELPPTPQTIKSGAGLDSNQYWKIQIIKATILKIRAHQISSDKYV